jgi:hypothetical protein
MTFLTADGGVPQNIPVPIISGIAVLLSESA